MKTVAFLLAITMVCGFTLASPARVQAAEVVGHLTQVEGRVEVLKGGQLPAVPVKVQDGVEKGDVIRTKSLSKAQVTFIDNSTVTLSPESRLAVDEYTFDSEKGKRNAVLQLFQGMALTVVTKFFKVEQPDFVVKTHTAVMGIRGTEVGIRLQPNSSTFLDFSGKACIGSSYAEVKGEVCLNPMEGTLVERGLPPTLPFAITPEDQALFMRQLDTGLLGLNEAATCQIAALTDSECGQPTSVTPAGKPLPGSGSIVTNTSNALYVPPVPTVNNPPIFPAPSSSVSQFAFAQNYNGSYQLASVSPFAVATFMDTLPAGSGTRTGVYPGNFTANFNITATSPQVNTFASFNTGTISAISSGNVSGVLGGALSGTMNMSATTSGGTSFKFAGPVSIQPSGALSYQTNGTFTLGSISGTTSGTWTQH